MSYAALPLNLWILLDFHNSSELPPMSRKIGVPKAECQHYLALATQQESPDHVLQCDRRYKVASSLYRKVTFFRINRY
jgi:hypothetical protein